MYLSVNTGKNNSQNKKILKEATKTYECPGITRNKELGVTNRSEVISYYNYNSVVDYDNDDALQRFGTIKIEATSFTISEPTTKLEITPLLYNFSTEKNKIY